MNTQMKKDSEPQTGIVKPRKVHPWRQQIINAEKLKAARKERKRIYERGELHREWERQHYRIKHGIDPLLPVMEPMG